MVYPPIAQSVERLPFKEMVPGSNPGGRTTIMKKFLQFVDGLMGKYLDTLALTLVVVGGILAATAIGELPEGGTTADHSFIYLKHPFNLYVGLVAMATGYIVQLWDNLVNVHHVDVKKIIWPMIIIFVSLLVTVFS